MLHARRSAGTIALACFASLGHAQASTAGDALFHRHLAKPGDTLIGLGQTLLVRPSDWPRIAALNRIDNPRRIPIGASIRIPLALMKSRPAPGTVVAVIGQATLAPARMASVPSRPATAAEAGATVAPGTLIQTGPDGYVTVRLADGSMLRVQSDTTAQVDRIDHYEPAGFFASRLSLLKGRLEALVAHMTGGEPRFEVKTPQALLGVRGTDFRIAVDEDRQSTRGEVLDGVVVLGSTAQTRTPQPLQRLAAGFGTRVGPQGGPAAPVRLASPPDLSAVPALHERILVRIEVPPVPGASAYRAQVASDEGFHQVLGELTSPTPKFRFAGLPDGHYHLRVRTADAQGIEGADATRQIHLKAHPEPPILSLPTPDGKLRATHATLAWAGQPEAASYRVQIAQDLWFERVLHDTHGLQDTQLSQALPVGDYLWRVASVRPDGDQGPFGDPQVFHLRAPPPQADPPRIDEHHLHFSWAAETGQTFEFQMARDEAFTHLLAQQALAEPAIQVDRPEHGGRLYIRYKAIDPDGFVGPFTTPQVVTLPHCVQDGQGTCLRTGHGGRATSPW